MSSKTSSANKAASDYKERRFYGRRSGKSLNKERTDAIEALLPKLCIPKGLLEDKGKDSAPLKLSALIPTSYKTNILEIGFGSGEHLHGLMQQSPDTGFIGVEPFINGMATFLRDITDMPHDNIRVYDDDVMRLIEVLENECLDKIYVLNPDPWHKKRHHKRRIINTDTLDHFARLLKPGGSLISSTDVPYLADWIIEKTTGHPSFTWEETSKANCKARPDWWIDNLYATKGAKGGSVMHYLIFKKND